MTWASPLGNNGREKRERELMSCNRLKLYLQVLFFYCFHIYCTWVRCCIAYVHGLPIQYWPFSLLPNNVESLKKYKYFLFYGCEYWSSLWNCTKWMCIYNTHKPERAINRFSWFQCLRVSINVNEWAGVFVCLVFYYQAIIIVDIITIIWIEEKKSINRIL